MSERIWPRFWRRVVDTLRRDFLAGLLVFVPVGFTILGVLWIINQLDRLVLPRVFKALGAEAQQPPFVGALATLLVILAIGALTRSFIGRTFLRIWEGIVERIPIARSMYSVVKQFMQAIVGEGSGKDSFDRVVIVEYPRNGLYSYAFVTGRQSGTQRGLPPGLLKIFIASTPNPTTGYFLLVRESELIETDLSVEDAFRLIVSAGIADPEGSSQAAAARLKAAGTAPVVAPVPPVAPPAAEPQ